MDGFVVASVGVLAMMTGFWAGRSVQWQLADEEDEEETGNTGYAKEGVERTFGRRKREKSGNVRRISLGREIASPAAGEVTVSVEDGKRVIRIRPEQGRLYAPASGKIERLYPMGCAMLLRTEFGAEILIKAGDHVDEMHSVYYRCRVMEHEIVRKGALLLEYDLEGLLAEGADTEVTMSLENESGPESIVMGANMRAKVGETIFSV